MSNVVPVKVKLVTESGIDLTDQVGLPDVVLVLGSTLKALETIRDAAKDLVDADHKAQGGGDAIGGVREKLGILEKLLESGSTDA